MERCPGNLTVHGVGHLVAIVKNRLKRILNQSDLIVSFFAHTGLALRSEST